MSEPQQLSFGDVADNDNDRVPFPRVVEVNDSSAITRLAYHPARRLLRAWFASTRTCWEYRGVYPNTFAGLVASYSVGQAFNKLIRDQYDAVKVEEHVTKHVPATKGSHATHRHG